MKPLCSKFWNVCCTLIALPNKYIHEVKLNLLCCVRNPPENVVSETNGRFSSSIPLWPRFERVWSGNLGNIIVQYQLWPSIACSGNGRICFFQLSQKASKLKKWVTLDPKIRLIILWHYKQMWIHKLPVWYYLNVDNEISLVKWEQWISQSSVFFSWSVYVHLCMSGVIISELTSFSRAKNQSFWVLSKRTWNQQ